VFYEVRDITNPENEGRFEIEVDEPPAVGETLTRGTMVWEVLHVQQAVITVTRQAGPGQNVP
jgi:hypothetical protein